MINIKTLVLYSYNTKNSFKLYRLGSAPSSCGSCGDHTAVVCGSDGASYRNKCELEKRSCESGRKIKLVRYSACGLLRHTVTTLWRNSYYFPALWCHNHYCWAFAFSINIVRSKSSWTNKNILNIELVKVSWCLARSHFFWT